MVPHTCNPSDRKAGDRRGWGYEVIFIASLRPAWANMKFCLKKEGTEKEEEEKEKKLPPLQKKSFN